MGAPQIIVFRRDRCCEGHYIIGLVCTALTAAVQ